MRRRRTFSWIFPVDVFAGATRHRFGPSGASSQTVCSSAPRAAGGSLPRTRTHEGCFANRQRPARLSGELTVSARAGGYMSGMGVGLWIFLGVPLLLVLGLIALERFEARLFPGAPVVDRPATRPRPPR
jgi:hypothetical protein